MLCCRAKQLKIKLTPIVYASFLHKCVFVMKLTIIHRYERQIKLGRVVPFLAFCDPTESTVSVYRVLYDFVGHWNVATVIISNYGVWNVQILIFVYSIILCISKYRTVDLSFEIHCYQYSINIILFVHDKGKLMNSRSKVTRQYWKGKPLNTDRSS